MKVTIIDYGISNLRSVFRAFEHVGAEVHVTSDAKEILNSDRVILPGVGAFADSMENLRKLNLVDTIHEVIKKSRPFMGICVGMQLLFDESDEFKKETGLSLIPGHVTKISSKSPTTDKVRIPHIGWSSLVSPEGKSFKNEILKNVKENDYVFFVHSFTSYPKKNDFRVADTIYEGLRLSAIVRKDNVIGCQFHVEKSGPVGLTIIKNFMEL